MTAAGTLERRPEQPGPGPMPETILRALDVSIGRRIGGLLAGDFRSKGLGAGTELAQVREYVPGDDVRLIDWNVTARTRVPHVRVHVAERMLTTWLAIDVSPSMTFGTADRRKYDVAEGVALAAGHVATRHGNALGVMTFGDGQERTLRPSQGRPGMLGLLLSLRTQPAKEAATGMPPGASTGQALAGLSHRAGHARLVLVVSDLRGPLDWAGALGVLCSRHEVVMVEVRDPREQELPDVGLIAMVDPETGRHLRVDTGQRGLRKRFAEAAAAERAEVAGVIRLAGARHIVLSTAGDWLLTLARGLRETGGRP